MPNDTIITIGRRNIPDNFIVDSMASLKPVIEHPQPYIPDLLPAPELPKFTFVYDSLEGIMPIDTIYTFSKSVEVIAFPFDCHVPDYALLFMTFLTVGYLIVYLGTWVKFIKELQSL